jgi:hypothetical protein
VERARIILGYLEEPSAYAVARTMGVSQQTVTRCLEPVRAETGGDVTPFRPSLKRPGSPVAPE